MQKDGTLDVSVIKNQIVAYDKRLKVPMSRCKSLSDIFEKLILPEYSSFLDYDLIKLLVDYGGDECKSEFIDYKKKLQNFLENRIIEQSTPGAEKSYAVVIDESITSDITDLTLLQNRVRIILGQKSLTLIPWENLQPNSLVNLHWLKSYLHKKYILTAIFRRDCQFLTRRNI